MEERFFIFFPIPLELLFPHVEGILCTVVKGEKRQLSSKHEPESQPYKPNC